MLLKPAVILKYIFGLSGFDMLVLNSVMKNAVCDPVL